MLTFVRKKLDGMADLLKSTKCACGNTIYYKTKPPTKCEECKSKRKGYSHKVNSSSNGELLMFNTLDSILKLDYINNGYYSWLQSPKGSPMQLDRYYPDIKLGFEYQGAQHYRFNKYFHKTKKQFLYLQQCDTLKSQLCVVKGITLIHIRYDKSLTREYLISRIQDTNLFDYLVSNKLIIA